MKFPELTELDRLRLTRNWTFEQLGDAMAKAKFPIPFRTLHYLLKRRPAALIPLDRTMFKIRGFLERERRLERDRRRRRAAPSTSVSASV